MRFPMLMAAAMIAATTLAGSANAALPFLSDSTNVPQAQACPVGEYWSPTQYFTHDGGLLPAGCYRN